MDCLISVTGAEHVYHILRVSTHGRLTITGQKNSMGAYMEKPFVCLLHIHVNHRIIKNWGWALTRETMIHVYHILPSKHPWALENHGPKNSVGAYVEKPFVCLLHIHMNHRIIKNWGVGAYSGDYGTCYL